MRVSYPSVIALVALVAGGLAVAELLGASRPSSNPVTVRGDDEARSLEAAIAAVRPDEIVTVLAEEAIPAVDRPSFVAAADAGLEPGENVVGVAIAGRARAYPVRVLSAHEIVNDDVAGKPYAVTW
jgi:hypothetical protein